MDFAEAYQMYTDWCQQLQAHHISGKEFTIWLDRLRVQDAQGQWWRIEHPSGVWLCWNGKDWEHRDPPGQAPPPQTSPKASPTPGFQEPQNLLQLFGWLFSSVLKGIPQQLFLGIVVGVIILLLHLFLLVRVNDGFNPSTNNPWLNSFLILGSQGLSSGLFWIFTGILLSQLLHGTLGKHLKAIAALPPTLVQFCQQSGQLKVPMLWLGSSLVLIFALFFGNLLVLLQVMLFTLVALQESNHFLRLVLKLGWQDSQKLWRAGQSPRPLTPEQSQQLLSGMVAGSTLAALIFWLAPPLLKLVSIAAIAVTLWQFFADKRPTPSSLSLFTLFVLTGLVLGQMEPAWADDSGWSECGRSLQTWIACQGTDKAVLNSALAGLGAWLGWILGGLQIPSAPMPSSSAISTTPGMTTLPQDIEYTYPDGRHTTLVYDPEKGGYINILTGGWIDPNEINAWQQNNLNTHQQTEDWRRRNEYLEATGQDAQSQRLKEIADKYEQERLAIAEQTKQAKQELKKLFEELQKSNYKSLEIYEKQARIMSGITSVLEGVKYGCDVGINVLEKITGPAGKVIRNGYTVLSGTAEGLGEGLAHGDVVNRTLKGTGKGLIDLGVRMGVEQPLTKWLGNVKKIPGFRDLKPGSNSMGFMEYGNKIKFGDVSVGKAIDAYLGRPNIDRFLSGHIQSHINHSLVNNIMRWGRNQTVYQPLKWGKDYLKKVIGS